MGKLQTIAAGLGKALHGLGLTMVVLGAAAVVAPWSSAAVMVVTVGLLLLIGGGILFVFGRSARAAGKGNAGLVVGGLTALCGLALVVQPSLGLATVRWLLLAYFFASGTSEAILALRLASEEGRGPALASALATLALGVVMLTGWPISGVRAIGLLVGLKLLTSGVTILRLHGTLRVAGERVAAVRERIR